jgi:hypothetical protein
MITKLINLEAFTCFLNNVHAYIVTLQLITLKSFTKDSNVLKVAKFFPQGNKNKLKNKTKLGSKKL